MHADPLHGPGRGGERAWHRARARAHPPIGLRGRVSAASSTSPSSPWWRWRRGCWTSRCAAPTRAPSRWPPPPSGIRHASAPARWPSPVGACSDTSSTGISTPGPTPPGVPPWPGGSRCTAWVRTACPTCVRRRARSSRIRRRRAPSAASACPRPRSRTRP